MYLRRTQETAMDTANLREMLEHDTLQVGDELRIGGDLWRVLKTEDHMAIIWKHTGLDKKTAFNGGDSNEYEGSGLQKACKAFKLPAELRNLTEEVYPLSIEEVKELLPTEGDRIAVDSNGETVPWWTRSANRGYGCNAWHVTPAGDVGNGNAAGTSFALAPACAISSS